MEFALFLPVFLMLLFSVVELGSAWYFKQMLVNATREGARMAALLNDASNASGQVVSQVNSFLEQSGFPGTANVTVSGADGNPGVPVNVTATSTYQMPILGTLVPGNLSSVTLNATTVMRHE